MLLMGINGCEHALLVFCSVSPRSTLHCTAADLQIPALKHSMAGCHKNSTAGHVLLCQLASQEYGLRDMEARPGVQVMHRRED